MSAAVVQTVIRKAVVDAEFRNLLVNDPAKALVGYDLTDAERTNLSQLTPDLFDAGGGDLEDRLSRGVALN